jgi:hypothetical protein
VGEIYWVKENPKKRQSEFHDFGSGEIWQVIPGNLAGAGNEAEEENPRDEDRKQANAWRCGKFDEDDQAEARIICAIEKGRSLAISEAEPWWGHFNVEVCFEDERD